MSVSSRREVLQRLKCRYQRASWADKGKILDEFVELTGYCRKHAIWLLNSQEQEERRPGSGRPRVYDRAVVDALAQVWRAMDRVCSKRLVPFLPEMVRVLERDGHLRLAPDVRDHLLGISASTADRLLADARIPRGVSTTAPSRLLKKQIPVRTHNDPGDPRPGFFEVDLVAHCGPEAYGAFLYTLVLTDIATGWTELLALPGRTGESVLFGIMRARSVLPFRMLGLDTDNGTEFINDGLVRYCNRQKIGFTRSRPYKKNDQAHVEERNGSVVRRLAGYDRFVGEPARAALSTLYEAHRLYLNCFQPMMKLESKERDGGHVTKRYQVARTPLERLLENEATCKSARSRLCAVYEALDPVLVLAQLRQLQGEFLSHAWNAAVPPFEGSEEITAEQMALVLQELPNAPKHRRTRKPRACGSQSNPFTDLWDRIEPRLRSEPFLTTPKLLAQLQAEYPGRFRDTQLGSLHKKVRAWRAERAASTRRTEPKRRAAAAVLETPAQPPVTRRQSHAFALVWDQISPMLAADPYLSAGRLLARLQERNPGRFDDGQLSTLRRLLRKWRATLNASSPHECPVDSPGNLNPR